MRKKLMYLTFIIFSFIGSALILGCQGNINNEMDQVTHSNLAAIGN